MRVFYCAQRVNIKGTWPLWPCPALDPPLGSSYASSTSFSSFRRQPTAQELNCNKTISMLRSSWRWWLAGFYLLNSTTLSRNIQLKTISRRGEVIENETGLQSIFNIYLKPQLNCYPVRILDFRSSPEVPVEGDSKSSFSVRLESRSRQSRLAFALCRRLPFYVTCRA